MKILKISLLALIVLAAVGYLATAWSLSGRVLFPTSSLEKTKARIAKSWGTTYEEVMSTMPLPTSFSVESEDGLKLSGRYFQNSDSSTCAIIFAHGWGAIWADMLKYSPAFADCNCDFVFYDHRVHGESEGTYATGGIKEAEDLWIVTEWVNAEKGFGLEQIGWVGSSWGAATSLIAGADPKDVGFIVADCPYQDWYSAAFERAIRDYGSGIKLLAPGVMHSVSMRSGVDYKDASPVEKAPEITEPVLLVHSQGDTQTSSDQSVNIAKNLDEEHSQFFHSSWGNDHVMDVVNNREDYRQLVYNFLKKEAPHFLKKETTEGSSTAISDN